jgi:hypothetical protein
MPVIHCSIKVAYTVDSITHIISVVKGMQQYEVITKGQSFTPQLVTTDSDMVSLFTLGQPARDSLEAFFLFNSIGCCVNLAFFEPRNFS